MNIFIKFTESQPTKTITIDNITKINNCAGKLIISHHKGLTTTYSNDIIKEYEIINVDISRML